MLGVLLIVGVLLAMPASATVGTPEKITTGATSWFPSITEDGNLTLHMIWFDQGSSDVQYAARLDGGNWEQKGAIAGSAAVLKGRLWIAADSGGNLHTFWVGPDGTGGFEHIYYATKNAGGEVWSAPENVSGTSGSAEEPRAFFDSGGKLHLAWREGGGGTIKYRMKEPSDSWTGTGAAVTLYDPAYYNPHWDMAIDADDNLHMVWEQSGEAYYGLRRVDGTIDARSNISNTGGASYHIRLDVDSDKRVHVVWNEHNGNGPLDIFYATSPQPDPAEADRVWDVVNVTNDSADSSLPEVAVDTGGNVHLVWRTNKTGSGYTLWYLQKPSTGPWPPVDDATDGAVKVSLGEGDTRNFQLLPTPGGAVHLVWSEENEIWYSSIGVEAPPGPGSSTINFQPDGNAGIDTWISNWDPDGNYGGFDHLEIGQDKAGHVFRGLIELDTAAASLPPNISVTSAVLEFHCAAWPDGTPRNSFVALALVDWQEGNLTGQPGIANWYDPSPGSPAWNGGVDGTHFDASNTRSTSLCSGYPEYSPVQIELDPAWVEGWANGTTANNGLFIMDPVEDQSGDRLSFLATSDHPDPTLRPRWVIEYVASGEPPPDLDPPTIVATYDPAANGEGWNNSAVTVTFTCTDEDSGVAECPDAISFGEEGAGQSETVQATDNAGNVAELTVTVSIDLTDPAIAGSAYPDANEAGWNNTDVTVQFDCQDDLSGIAACTPDVVLNAEGADQSVTGQAVDLAGNSAEATVEGINIDKTAPDVAIDAPAEGGVVAVGAAVSFACTDGLAGVATCDGTLSTVDGSETIADGFTIETPGIYELQVVAIDNADNEAVSEIRNFVVYDPDDGFLTAGGWVPSSSGKLNFGFEVRYRGGADRPSGQLELQLREADLNLHVSDFDWLVVVGNRATFNGTGTNNGAGNYGILVTVLAGEGRGPDRSPDMLRIQVRDLDDGGNVVYDSQPGAAPGADPTTALGGGSITIHE